MRERPILFSGPMVRAILDGRKVQTRRAIKHQPPVQTTAVSVWHHPDPLPHFFASAHGEFLHWSAPCPYGQRGDRLWVRETWQHEAFPFGPYRPGAHVYYRADYFDDPHGPDGERSPEGKYRVWRPSIHMPRAASRILLEITAVRVERLQEISEADAKAEGIYLFPGERGGYKFARGEQEYDTAREAYRDLWISINGPDSWDGNPWVWVVEFRAFPETTRGAA